MDGKLPGIPSDTLMAPDRSSPEKPCSVQTIRLEMLLLQYFSNKTDLRGFKSEIPGNLRLHVFAPDKAAAQRFPSGKPDPGGSRPGWLPESGSAKNCLYGRSISNLWKFPVKTPGPVPVQGGFGVHWPYRKPGSTPPDQTEILYKSMANE